MFWWFIAIIGLLCFKCKEGFWNQPTRRDFKIADIRGEPNLVYPVGYIYFPFHFGVDGRYQPTKGKYFLH
jgi:hypothetical protein